MKVPFYKHNLQQDDIDELVDTLGGVFLTTGPKTKKFEEDLANYLQVKHVVGSTSWTNAAFLVLKAWGVGPGVEVIVPPLTFISTANIVLHCGATPVFADVCPDTGNIDPVQIRKAITPRTKAIIPVHLYGQMADMDEISSIAAEHKLKVLEDCAHCVEGTRNGYRPGQKSDAACFSFYATKNITSGEGGAIATNDNELVEKLLTLRMNGMNKSASDRYTSSYKHWDMSELGYKANMSDIQASLLLNQLTRIEETLTRKERICRIYESRFQDAGITFPRVLEGSRSARHLFTFLAPQGKRDAMLDRLQADGIGVAVNFRPVHLMEYYAKRFGFQPGSFIVAESIGDRTITVPMYPKLTDVEVNYVANRVTHHYLELEGQLKKKRSLTASQDLF